MRKIKVAHAVRSLEFGGAEKLVLELAALQKDAGRVHPELVCIKGLGPLKSRADELNLNCNLVGMHGVRYLSAIARLFRLFSRSRPDIVHTHNLVSHVHAAPAARLARIPVVHTKHGKAVSSFKWSPAFRRFLYNLADRIVVVSRDTGESFKAKAGVDEDKVVVIYNGIDTGRYVDVDGGRVRGMLGIDGAALVMGSVSRLDPVKDHTTILKAFKRISGQRDDCVLLIVGDGPERGRIERMVDDLGLKGRVLMPGFTDDVPGFLAAMDLFLQPSREEGLSLTILEAAASGVAVVATPVGGTPEIIRNGETGILVDVGDVDALAGVMADFLRDPEPFTEMAARAREEIGRSFDLNRMTKRYESLYLEVLGERRN